MTSALEPRFEDAARRFAEVFGAEPEAVASAPGRVNLIGEHTDYNEGFVFPMAIGFRIEAAARRRDDAVLRLHAVDLGESCEVRLDREIAPDDDQPWSNYARGVVAELREAAVSLSGMDISFGGDVPLGAGLSSSAALEVAVALVVCRSSGVDVGEERRPWLARICQRAEHRFAGTQCGIMDQFISLLGADGHALFLDCRDLGYRRVPLSLGDDHRIVIIDSAVKHSLASSAYNERRAQCAAGVEVLTTRWPGIGSLRETTEEALALVASSLEPVVHDRCRHVITENLRVERAVAALESGDLERLGREMDASHASLRDDYAVSCDEVDRLVELARALPGVLGARITGGGFGGCTVNLVHTDALPLLEERVVRPYHESFGLSARVIVTDAAPGAVVAIPGSLEV